MLAANGRRVARLNGDQTDQGRRVQLESPGFTISASGLIGIGRQHQNGWT